MNTLPPRGQPSARSVRSNAEASMAGMQPQADVDSAASAARATPGPIQLAPAVKLDKYTLRSLIGTGGHGDVWEAEHSFTKRLVALKCLQLRRLDMEVHRARLQKEAIVLSELHHPNIVEVLDGGMTDWGMVFMVMERLFGLTLRTYSQRKGRVKISWALLMAAEIADGLAAAHAIGVVHRDLKPENVFLTKDKRIKVLDLGVAKFQDSDIETEDGVIVGTPYYMSPEHLDGQKVDGRTDVYGLFAILYELLAGRHMYALGSGNQGLPDRNTVALLHMQKMPRPLPEIVPAVDDELWAFIASGLAKDRAQRPASMPEVSRACRQHRARIRAQADEEGVLYENEEPEEREFMAASKPHAFSASRNDASSAAGPPPAPSSLRAEWQAPVAPLSRPSRLADLVHTERMLPLAEQVGFGGTVRMAPLTAVVSPAPVPAPVPAPAPVPEPVAASPAPPAHASGADFATSSYPAVAVPVPYAVTMPLGAPAPLAAPTTPAAAPEPATLPSASPAVAAAETARQAGPERSSRRVAYSAVAGAVLGVSAAVVWLVHRSDAGVQTDPPPGPPVPAQVSPIEAPAEAPAGSTPPPSSAQPQPPAAVPAARHGDRAPPAVRVFGAPLDLGNPYGTAPAKPAASRSVSPQKPPGRVLTEGELEDDFSLERPRLPPKASPAPAPAPPAGKATFLKKRKEK